LYTRYTTLGVSLMMVINLALFGVAGLTVWAVQMAWIPFFAAGVVNGIGHYWGYRNFDNSDAATNIFPWGILIGGEELHNNHHTYATSAKLSNKWYEFDIGWMYIRILSALGLATVKKTPPKPVFVKNTPVDEHTLESIIKNRYEVMASYTISLKSSLKAEVEKLGDVDKTAAKRLARLKKLILKDTDNISPEVVERLEGEIKVSPTLQKMYDMRNELATLWRRSNLSREQLLAHLHDWCERAEQSGIAVLQKFAMQLRTYR
jgi:stearoyl-CoA desaturase (delta-9 desaturase)